MKFLLVLHMCSFLSNTCPGVMHPHGVFKTWHDCSLEGYKISRELLSKIDPKLANEKKLAIKFECKELPTT